MSKKIIIKESQYNRMLKLLVETEDVNHTLDFANANDVLLFKGINGLNLKIQVISVNQNNGEILGQTEKGKKVKFTFNSYDEQSKKFDFKAFNPETNSYVDEPFEVKSMDIIRNGNVVQIPNTPNTEVPTDSQDELNPDGVSQPIDLSPEITGKEEDNKAARKALAKDVYNAMMDSDTLRDILYKKPSFLSLLKAEILGKPAQGTGQLNIAKQEKDYNAKIKKNNGLGALLKIVTNQKQKEFTQKLNADFPPRKMTLFTPYNEVLTFSTIENKNSFVMKPGGSYFGTNMSLSAKSKFPAIKNSEYGYKVIVKDKTQVADVFNCNIVKTFKTKTGEIKSVRKDNVYIRFEKSDGYQPTKNNK
jgi:hypothetical protein